MRILIIANSRYKGGLSGSDAIYESFKRFWPVDVDIWDLLDLDYRPFFLCYLHRIFLSCYMAITCKDKYDLVYSASDFFPDSIAGFFFKLRGFRWCAGYYLEAFKENKIHSFTQKIAKFLIKKLADMVIVTNPTMYRLFPEKEKTWINGGIDLSKAGYSGEKKIYDAVFCGRIHPSKGIDELIEIWDLVRKKKPDAKLAVIGDGDLGKDYIQRKLFARYGRRNFNGMDLLGYMGDERFDIYRKSKLVLYPTPLKYDHFSMAPVEAMACGCPCVAFDLDTFRAMCKYYLWSAGVADFVDKILYIINRPEKMKEFSDKAIEYAQHFDYKQQSLRVFEEIKKGIYEGSSNGF